MLIAVTVALPVLLGVTGFAVDMGRLYVAQANLQAAVDAAALSGSLQLVNDPEVSNGMVANSITEYLTRNYPGASVSDLTSGTDVRSVCLTGQMDVPMMFMPVLAINSRPVTASACAGFNDVEVALVLDNTSSMNGTPIDHVKQAATQLVDLMIPDGTSSPAIKVGLVPFRGKVRVRSVAGLPIDRPYSDACLTRDNRANEGNSADTCQGALTPILPLSHNKNDIKNDINIMSAPGGSANSGTLIMEGIKWGRDVLLPDGYFMEGGSTKRFRKVMIFLSDGDNTINSCDCDAYRALPLDDESCNSSSCRDVDTRQEADLAKAEGIEIFSINYYDGGTNADLMRYIASSKPGTNDHYFETPNADDIPNIMKKIGRQLGFRLL